MVVFGVKHSPFLLSATIAFHLNRSPVHLKPLADKLKYSFYVENCVISVNRLEELASFMNESKYLMSSGYCNLRDWVYTGMNVDNMEQSINTLHGRFILVFGILWNFEKYMLFIDTREN